MSRIHHFEKQADVTDDMISPLTKKNSRIAKDFLVRYDICDEYKPFVINSFQTIGWSDPFPNDDEFITGSLDDGHNLKVPE